MKASQIAAQLYTCRDLLQNPAGIATTLKRVRAIGYTAVQLSGLGPIRVQELRQILDDNGLTCCTTHEPAGDILNHPERVIERLEALRCDITAYPYPAGVDFSHSSTVSPWIKSLQHSGEVLAAAGKLLTYHNHNHEFRKLDGKVILDLIYAGTTPAALQAELDVYWAQYGGANIIDWIRKLSGRLPVVHLKDYCTTPENKPLWCELGDGVLDFPAIIPAAAAAGCRWFIVEQDTCPGDPVDSLAISFRYLQGLVSAP
jgi:sugar phosphate isomerase/epimerase